MLSFLSSKRSWVYPDRMPVFIFLGGRAMNLFKFTGLDAVIMHEFVVCAKHNEAHQYRVSIKNYALASSAHPTS